jgi:hypothetical protein
LAVGLLVALISWTERKYEISLEKDLAEQTFEDSRDYVKEIVDF